MSDAYILREVRMQHPNAVLTPRGRRRLVALVDEQGLSFRAAAAAMAVSVSTAHAWVSRWRAAGAAERASLSCLADRASRPHRSPGATSLPWTGSRWGG